MYEDRRKFKRVKLSNLAKVNDSCCSLHNVSRDGFLLTTEPGALGQGKNIDIKLKIKGEWVDLKALIIWSIPQKKEGSDSVSIGGYITDAPKEYMEFIENLYLEASEE